MKSKALDRAVGNIKLVLAQREIGEKDLAMAIGLTADEVFQIARILFPEKKRPA